MTIAEMTKAELQAARAECIEALASAITVGRREEVQADLSNINARLKQLNTEEARQLKAIADQRKAAGHAEQTANLRRASTKIPAMVRQSVSNTPTVKLSAPKPVAQQRSLTRGEFLLKHAKQMRKGIDSIKPERRLAHTVTFRDQLDAFIVEQKRHLDEQKTAKAPDATTEDAWQQTWTAEAAGTRK